MSERHWLPTTKLLATTLPAIAVTQKCYSDEVVNCSMKGAASMEVLTKIHSAKYNNCNNTKDVCFTTENIEYSVKHYLKRYKDKLLTFYKDSGDYQEGTYTIDGRQGTIHDDRYELQLLGYTFLFPQQGYLYMATEEYPTQTNIIIYLEPQADYIIIPVPTGQPTTITILKNHLQARLCNTKRDHLETYLDKFVIYDYCAEGDRLPTTAKLHYSPGPSGDTGATYNLAKFMDTASESHYIIHGKEDDQNPQYKLEGKDIRYDGIVYFGGIVAKRRKDYETGNDDVLNGPTTRKIDKDKTTGHP
ncbi:unnamed protein product [Prorocentrum cordatum]|uniref:Uncharacterized protein n=1 Tax=Prorocentrum cordatum TaxID=2364126 RepID=A0ABN9Y6T9_9DINO|nr:unnamed protein product [Polarella glacialis]